MAGDWYAKLKDPRWQKKRLEIMQRDEFACVVCGDTESTLNVHHGFYEKGHAPWEYPDNTLWTLCEECHESTGNIMRDIHLEIGRLDPHFLYEFFGYLMEAKTYIREVIMHNKRMEISKNVGNTCIRPNVIIQD